MGRRTADEQYVDVMHDGITITSPTESLFLPAGEIDRVRYTFPLRRLQIRTGMRRIKIKNVIESQKIPAKISLGKWLRTPAPTRKELQAGKIRLKQAIEELI